MFRVTPLPPPSEGGPVTAWAGPASGDADAVRVAARVLRLPPSMLVTVDGLRVGDGATRWERIGTTTAAAARVAPGT